MKDGMRALTTAMAHVQAHRDHALKVKDAIKGRAIQYSGWVLDATKRLDADPVEVLSENYDTGKRQKLVHDRGILENIIYSD